MRKFALLLMTLLSFQAQLAQGSETQFDKLIDLLGRSNGPMKIGKCTVWLSSSESRGLIFDLNFKLENKSTTLQLSSPEATGGRSLVKQESFGYTYRESDVIGWTVLEVRQDNQ